MQLPLYQLDAFTALPFSGNPAAVVLLDAQSAPLVSSTVRQQIAAEMNLSETAFVEVADKDSSIQDASDFRLSWYTPVKEVPLCGHGTLAAAAALAFGEDNKSVSLNFHTTYSGTLTVRQSSGGDGQLEMDFPNERPDSDCPEWAAGTSNFNQALLGDSISLFSSSRFNSRIHYLVVRLKKGTTREQLEAVRPDFEQLRKEFSAASISMAILTISDPTGEYDVLSRAFAPWSGIPEDSVTGSAHAVIAADWAAELEKTSLRARQCSPRGGDLLLRVENDRVKISGKAAIVSKGTLYLPEDKQQPS